MILAAPKAEIVRIVVQGSLHKKLLRLHLTQKKTVVACSCHLSYLGSINKRTAVQAIQALTVTKRARGEAQVRSTCQPSTSP
jgi:hypothetical protein